MSTFSELGIEEKQFIVEHFDDLSQIPLECLPDSVNSAEEEGYYFISYSRKDYKTVYKNLFDFQKLGSVEIDGRQIPLRFFYDRRYAINSGENWETIADKFILPQPCKGIIFFISENSLRSEAIAKEMQFAKEHLKQVMTVILPFPRDIVKDGINQKGNDKLTAVQYLDLLIEEEQDEKELKKLENTKNIMSGFITESTTYLSYSADTSFKAKSIANNLTGLPLLNIDNNILAGINNNLAREIKASDFYSEINVIGHCAFANCTKLEKIEFSESLQIMGQYSFYNCGSLKYIDLSRASKLSGIGMHAFHGCLNLEKIDLPKHVSKIEAGAFFWCRNLKDVVMPENLHHIGESAFAHCGLKNIIIPNRVCEIKKHAFHGCENLNKIILSESLLEIEQEVFRECKKLKSISLPKNVETIGNLAFGDCTNLEKAELSASVKVIGDGAFARCSKLKAITIYKSIEIISRWAFEECVSLSNIHFVGTKEQWTAIDKEPGWDFDTGSYTVHCTDGDILKEDK